MFNDNYGRAIASHVWRGPAHNLFYTQRHALRENLSCMISVTFRMLKDNITTGGSTGLWFLNETTENQNEIWRKKATISIVCELLTCRFKIEILKIKVQLTPLKVSFFSTKNNNYYGDPTTVLQEFFPRLKFWARKKNHRRTTTFGIHTILQIAYICPSFDRRARIKKIRIYSIGPTPSSVWNPKHRVLDVWPVTRGGG